MRKTQFALIVFLFMANHVFALSPAMFGTAGGGDGYSPSAPAANDFSGDTNCVALYKFESGALTTDGKSTNTLVSVNSPTSNTSDFKEGSGSVDLSASSSQYFYVTDTNLASGFPLKSGDTGKTISVCAWIYLNSYPADNDGFGIWTKWGTLTSERSFAIWLSTYGTTNQIELGIGYNNGGSGEYKTHSSDLALDTWYHVTVSFTDSTKAWAIRIRDASGNTVGTDATGTATNNINVEASRMVIGAMKYDTDDYRMPFDGIIDELVVFKDAITSGEATDISKGLYP